MQYLSIRSAGDDALSLIGGMEELEHLYLWVSDERISDLTSLSVLSNLTRLFVDAQFLTFLDGIQTLKKLQYLDVRCGAGINAALDPGPLRELTTLVELNAEDLDMAALEDVLPSLPLLRRVGCADGQRVALNRMLGERPDGEIIYF